MKSISQKFALTLACISCLTFINCNSDDINQPEKESIPLFTESDMSLIHGDSEKSWHITEVINIYYDPSDPLEIDIDCLRDDVYTFHKDDLSFSVDLGENKCFGQNNDGIFVADEEIFDGELIYMNASQGETIYMRYSIGFMNSQGSAQGISIRHYTLAELSENRMVFHREGGEFLGEYNQALVFKSL